MSLFIFSLLAGFLGYQVISLIQPIAGTRDYRLGRGRVVLHLPPEAYLAWKAGLIALCIVVFVLAATIIIVQPVHPAQGYAYRFVDALTSPRMAAAVFGGLVGLLVGNLLNRILQNPATYTFKASDYLEIVLIVFLVILGIGGEEVIQSYARRINKISVGTTTEISFSESRPRPARDAAERPNQAFRTTPNQMAPNGDYGGDVGLNRLSDLYYLIRTSDVEFINVLAHYEGGDTPNVVEPGNFAEDALRPIGECLSDIATVGGDSGFSEAVLSPLSTALRDIVLPHNTGFVEVKQKLQQSIDHLHQYAEPMLPQLRLVAAADNRPPPCEAPSLFDETTRKDKVLNDQVLQEFKATADAAPYVAIAYASAMAARKQYETAAATMYKWIDGYSHKMSSYPQEPVEAKWYRLRARFAQGFFVDEWLRVEGTTASSLLRGYHIGNLEHIAREMESFRVVLEITRRNDGYTWSEGLLGLSHSDDDGACDVPDVPKSSIAHVDGRRDIATGLPDRETQKTLRKVYQSYLSARRDYVDHALKHPILKISSAAPIEDQINSLMKLNLRCIASEQVSDRKSVRAETIERYVRSEINMMDNLSPLQSSDQIRDRIRANEQLLALAVQLVLPQVRVGPKATSSASGQATPDPAAFHDLLQGEPGRELYETLLATQAQLRDFTEREVNP